VQPSARNRAHVMLTGRGKLLPHPPRAGRTGVWAA
jgi:hypothetical protein